MCVAPFDFIPVEVKFNISGGERVCHMIGLVNNTVSERTESFTVMLTSSNSVASPNQAIVYITDDDGTYVGERDCECTCVCVMVLMMMVGR